MRLQVTATIQKVECVRQEEGALVPALDPTSEPYLWAAMFVIDGHQVLIVDPPNFTLHVPDPPLRIDVNTDRSPRSSCRPASHERQDGGGGTGAFGDGRAPGILPNRDLRS